MEVLFYVETGRKNIALDELVSPPPYGEGEGRGKCCPDGTTTFDAAVVKLL